MAGTSNRQFVTLLAVLLVLVVGFLDFGDCQSQKSQRRRLNQISRAASARTVRQSKFMMCEESEEDRKHWQSKCTCPKIYAPVCASDDVTYHNRCFLECKIKHQYFRYRAQNLRLKKMEPCESGVHDTSFALH